MLVLSTVLLVGCGGGGEQSSSVANNNSLNNTSSIKKVLLTKDNKNKFVQAVFYLENLEFSDIPNEGKGVRVIEDLDALTGKGTIETHYTNTPYKSGISLNGISKLDIIDVTKTSTEVLITAKGKYDIVYVTQENNITLQMEYDTKFKVTENGESFISLTVNKYHIIDQKNVEEIDVVVNGNTEKLYLKSEGYVTFTSDDDKKYILRGLDNTKLKITFNAEKTLYETKYAPPADPINGQPVPYKEKIYKGKKGQGRIVTILNGKQQDDLYFIPLKVSKFEPPKFYEQYGNASLLEYSFFTWHAKYRLLNKDINNTQIKIEWFVNDVKVDTPMQYELPLGSFSASDTVKIVVIATHGDVSIQKESVLDSSVNDYNVASGTYEYPNDTYEVEYRTDSLEVNLDLLAHDYFKSIDINSSSFSWNMLSISKCQPESLPGGGILPYGGCSYILEQSTKYQKIPKFSAKSYGSLYEPLYLMIYEGNEVKVVRFNITLMRGTSGIEGNGLGNIITSINEVNITQDRYVSINKVEHADLDDNGLDDIIYTGQTNDGDFLNVSYQNEKRVFTVEKIQNNGKLFLGDYDGDGVKEAFMFGAKSSQLISLEKGNLHVIKDINITNTLNIVADMNNDGKDDLIISNSQENKLYIYENLNDLTQKRLVGASVCQGVQAIKDINSDGLNDIICKPRRKETHVVGTDLFSSELFIDYFLQEGNGTYILKKKEYILLKDVTFSKASQTRVSAATMLDDSKMVVSLYDGENDTLYTCDLMHSDVVPSSKTDTNSYNIDAFLQPTDVNHDGKVDLLYYREYGNGELGVFYQLNNFAFDADYKVKMNASQQLTDRFFRNAFLDDIDNDGSLEIVTVNGENQFSYINLK